MATLRKDAIPPNSAAPSTVGRLVEECGKKRLTGLLSVSLLGPGRGAEPGALRVYFDAGRVVYVAVGGLQNEGCLRWIEASSVEAGVYKFEDGARPVQGNHADLGAKLFPLFGIRMAPR